MKILISGCSRGIGLATANLYLENHNVSVIGTSTSGHCTILHPNLKCFSLDLSSSESISNFVSLIKDLKFDILINNAAILLDVSNQLNVDLQLLKKTFEVNVFGTIELTELILPYMNAGGHIINISSEWGAFSESNFNALHPHYKMSKAALNMYTKLLAKRLEHTNINVSALDPGWTQTNMGGNEAPRKPMDVAQEIVKLSTSIVPSGIFWHLGKARQW